MNTFLSRAKRLQEYFLSWISPHPAIQDIAEFGRTQLLNAITLILIFLFIIGLLASPASVEIFEIMLGLSIVSFIFGKTRFAKIGLIGFSTGFTLVPFAAIYYGLTEDSSSVVLSIVPIALITANILVGRNAFLATALLASLLSFLVPSYAAQSVNITDYVRTGGVTLAVGAVLFGLSVFRTAIENKRLAEIIQSNRELETVKATLEEKVAERTIEIENKSRQFEVRAATFQNLSEISSIIINNAALSLQDLMNLTTENISNSFGYYHVGIFLLDENREFAILRAANSAGGKKMLARQHQLKVGGIGVVSYAAQSGYIRTALNTGADAVFFNNPDLPETRSEIAIPLKVGNRILGVLDVQSTQPSAFGEDDILVLQTLTNQVALSIMAAMLRENPVFSATKSAWGVQKRTASGFAYRSDGSVIVVEPHTKPLYSNLVTIGETPAPAYLNLSGPVSLPVKFRDQLIGVLQIEPEDAKRRWSEDEILMIQAIAERAALALENARLLEETSRRAEQEHIIADITSRISSSSRMENILQTTIQELGRLLGGSRTYVQFSGIENGESSNNMEKRTPS